MRWVITLTGLLALAIILVVGCGGATDKQSGVARDSSAPFAKATLAPAQAAAPMAISGEEGASFTVLSASSVDRMIVRNVDMTILVDDISKTLEQVSTLAQEMGGFVVSSSIFGEGAETSANVTIRIPSERTDETLDRLRDMAVRVPSETSRSQDVTEEYVDLEAGLRNLEAAEQQYLSFMGRAKTVEELLKVQEALTDVQGQLEHIRGRMQYLEQTSSTSLISIQMGPASSPGRLIQEGWSPSETTKSAVRTLSAFGQAIANAAIRVGVFAPVWVPLLALVSILGWIGWRRLRGRQTTS